MPENADTTAETARCRFSGGTAVSRMLKPIGRSRSATLK
jgi:hypothetical protein